ncbi:methionyl-tRNA formyltransferase [Aureivirga marina]|uniref:methionyl-tRNA formyltransferase n=1 Tax=Aureivirga marina TaxID=1182451 RepID=UPI0018CB18A7|nr:methionyl-tRNA formyltransferase [Aureivirga marina]
MRDLRIVFMGTPDFAVTILDGLLENNYNVVAVITAPDKPAGRGRKLNQSAVKKYAIEKNLPVLQPTNLKNEEFLAELESYKPNLNIVVAFRMLPKVVWGMPEFGTFNLHASLLPEYRGAAPINWAIINGETKTGVTTFFIDEKIDTGEIILQKETPISETETVGKLHDRLMHMGSDLVVETVKLIAENKAITQKQPEKEEKTAYKIHTDTCKINWENSLEAIYNHIRGLNPYPAAWTNLVSGDKELSAKIYNVKKVYEEHSFENGKIIATKSDLKVAVKDGFLKIDSLKLSGKKLMDAKSLMNGFTFQENARML